jgi:spore maturation protein CgeB
MLKVLYLPIGKQPGTEKAFRDVGVNLCVFDFQKAAQKSKTTANSEFLSHIESFKPDLVHMQLQMTDIITNDSLQKARSIAGNAIFTNWTGDIRKEPSVEFLKRSAFMDYSLISSVGQIAAYTKAGCKNPIYWQIGYDPQIGFPKWNKEFKYDVVFTGNAYPGHLFPDATLRLQIAKTLKSKFGSRCGIFGSGYPSALKVETVAFNQANNVYNDSICVLSVNNFNDVMHYFSDRLLMCVASGRPTITYRFPGVDSYFTDMSDVLVAKNAEHIIELVEFCKNNSDKANNIGLNGYRRVYSEHTFTSRVIELLTFTNLVNKI